MNKKRSLALGILLGIAVMVSLGVVFIDSTSVFWKMESGIVKLYVSNSIPVMNVDTNTQRIGIFSTNTTYAFEVLPRRPSTNALATGQSSALVGGMNFQGAKGGDSIRGTTATGGAGGNVFATGGDGGEAPLAQTNYTGGAGGGLVVLGGTGGGATTGIATNNATGGNGGAFSLLSGPGGSPATAATNAAGGNGGTINIAGGAGGTPTAGWSRKTGNGGLLTFSGGNSGDSTRTNTGNGGTISFTAGSSGNVTTAPGDPGIAGDLNFTSGNGGGGGTNANGGSQYFLPGTGAITGNIVIGRNVSGTARGGLQVGPLVAGTTATLTNLLTITAVLDFPSLAAGTVTDLPVAFAGAADGDVVVLAVPLSSVTNCMWLAFASNAVVYVRAHNGQLVTAQDPNSGTFRIKLEKYR